MMKPRRIKDERREKITISRGADRDVEDRFLRSQNIHTGIDYTKEYPDVIVEAHSLCLEIVSVNFPEVKTKQLKGLFRGWEQIDLNPKYHNDVEYRELIAEIKEAIQEKDGKPNYKSFPEKYSRRILLVRINGYFVYDENLMKILQSLAFFNLELNVFNEVYLTIYPPKIPTKYDIANGIIPPQCPEFTRVIYPVRGECFASPV